MGEWKSKWIINNEGWNSELTYKDDQQITGIIGDSYIQTIYFDPKNHVYNLFKNQVPSREYYAFGIQGASFSQYLNILKYASEKYQMDSVFIFLDNNDIEESIFNMVRMPRNMQLKIKDDIVTEVPAKYHEKIYRNLLKEMAGFRYFLMNFSFRLDFGAAKENKKKEISDGEVIEKMKRQAVKYIVNKIKSCKVKHITFVLDANREDIYRGGTESHSKFWKYFPHIEDSENVLVIDLHPFLKEVYAENKVQFEISDENNHWNLETNKMIVKYVSAKAGMR